MHTSCYPDAVGVLPPPGGLVHLRVPHETRQRPDNFFQYELLIVAADGGVRIVVTFCHFWRSEDASWCIFELSIGIEFLKNQCTFFKVIRPK